MKTITIAGRLTKDAEGKRTHSGEAILQFTVAVDDYSGKEKTTLFFDAALFGKRAASLEQYLVKGANVAVSGDFSVYNAESGKTYLKVRTNDITLMGGPQKREEAPRQDKQSRPAPGGPSFSRDMDDDIPFLPERRV